MVVDIHNHTTLCNHASGSVEEFIEKAISNGTKYYGFSEHAPMNFDEKYRMSFKELDLYEDMIKKAKEKYKDKIAILTGYEVDFIDGLIDNRVISRDVDYFIGSVHFLSRWGFDNPAFIGEYKNKDIDKIWEEYFFAIKSMAKSGLFDIVGHLDLIKIFKYMPKKDIRVIAKDAISAIKKADMVVEFNSAGLRKPVAEIYPSGALIEMLKESDIKITFSSDAHKIEDVGYGSSVLLSKAKEFGFNEIVAFNKRDKLLIKI